MKKICITKNVFKKLWLFSGVILLLCLSLPGQIFFAHYFHFHIQCFPVFPFLMTGILSYPFGREFFGVIMVPSIIIFSLFPLIFFIYGTIQSNKKSFLIAFIVLTTIIMLIDTFFFCANWNGAIHYQGKEYLYRAALRSSASFLAIYLFIIAYFMKRNSIFLHIALIIFCIIVLTIAFPWLGESL